MFCNLFLQKKPLCTIPDSCDSWISNPNWKACQTLKPMRPSRRRRSHAAVPRSCEGDFPMEIDGAVSTVSKLYHKSDFLHRHQVPFNETVRYYPKLIT